MSVDATSFINKYISVATQVMGSLSQQIELIEEISESLVKVSKQGGVIYACGNGGSACEAMHLVEELVARYLRERPGIKAQNLVDPSIITCWANDYNFDGVFSRQVETMLTSKDALVSFTTSGNSTNIINAINAANKINAQTITLSGKDGGKAKAISKLSLVVNSNITSHIQEAHIAVVHIICDLMEQQLFA